jgi:bifunctional non-homologous end joining protein LigD
VTEKDKSVISKKTIEQVEKTSDKIWKSNREQKASTGKRQITKTKKSEILDPKSEKKSTKKKTKRQSHTVKT